MADLRDSLLQGQAEVHEAPGALDSDGGGRRGQRMSMRKSSMNYTFSTEEEADSYHRMSRRLSSGLDPEELASFEMETVAFNRRTSPTQPMGRQLAQYQRRSSEKETPEARAVEARKTVQAILKESPASGGSSLKVWFRHFDKDRNGRIDRAEYRTGMQSLIPEKNMEDIFDHIDIDGSGDLTLEEIDEQEAFVWDHFRMWCGCRFTSARDLIRQLKMVVNVRSAHSVHSRSLEDVLTEQEFEEALLHLGWEDGFETLLFHSLDTDDEGFLRPKDFRWLEGEIRRFKQKEDAKARVMRLNERKAKHKNAGRKTLRSFKAFLKKKYGLLFRAWRHALDLDGTMSVQRPELFKACRALNWRGDVRALWKALDHDGSGVTTLEELDPACAQLLCQFKDWAVRTFSGTGKDPLRMLWTAFDNKKRKRLTYGMFAHECEARGFNKKPRLLAQMLDWQDNKYITEEDLHFMETWRAPDWLVAMPSYEDAEDFKRLLRQKYGHVLKAWRLAMDKDNSNSCNWHEFQDAAKHIKHTGNVAATYLALDEDVSGSISLKEIAPDVYSALVSFKKWCDSNFGGVRSAFQVLDLDKSRSLSWKEFNNACRMYGFNGNRRQVFSSLDQQSEEKLNFKEVAFLDDWDMDQESENGDDDAEELLVDSSFHMGSQEGKRGVGLLKFTTLTPGPGAYNIVPSFGAKPDTPHARHGGSHTFTFRRPWLDLKLSRKTVVGPANYEPELTLTSRRKAAWSFGKSMKFTATAKEQEDKKRQLQSKMIYPGPGAYEVKAEPHGPQYSFKPRRSLTLHPAEKTTAVL
eukprot:TRINITY_DN24136_c0_g2_i1.p1 TRINITY_DN24136_c0_g2~~TRINITY_DN24136_c0_g2_i1.p1  ORF type:complete len:804 (+),score=204.67 TRINITY_DN24136_c0_g2_i1:185-2596(+)